MCTIRRLFDIFKHLQFCGLPHFALDQFLDVGEAPLRPRLKYLPPELHVPLDRVDYSSEEGQSEHPVEQHLVQMVDLLMVMNMKNTNTNNVEKSLFGSFQGLQYYGSKREIWRIWISSWVSR